MGQLTPKAHSLFDVYLICFLALSPILFGIEGPARWILWTVCAVHILVTAASKTPLGMVRLIPFPVHGMIELVVGLVFPFIPLIFGFSHLPNERHLFNGLGFGILVLWLLTDYKFISTAWNKEAHVDTGVDITAQNLVQQNLGHHHSH